MSTWPPGYRADPEKAYESWLDVNIGNTMVVTAIATQGYGDKAVGEWVTDYILLYSQGSEYLEFRDTSGESQVSGN